MHDHSHKKYCCYTQQHTNGYAAPHLLQITGAKKLTGQNCKTICQTHSHHHQQHKNGRSGPHCRKSVYPDRPPHNDNIRNTVNLLKYVPDNQGDHESQQQFKGVPCRHIFFHKIYHQTLTSSPVFLFFH